MWYNRKKKLDTRDQVSKLDETHSEKIVAQLSSRLFCMLNGFKSQFKSKEKRKQIFFYT